MVEINTLMSDNLKNKTLIILALIFLIVVAGNDISKRAVKIFREKQEISQFASKLKSYPELEKSIAILSNQSDKAGTAANFDTFLKELAPKYGADIKIENESDGFANFKIEILASYKNLLGFLDAINNSEYPVKLNIFDIKKEGDKFLAVLHGELLSAN